MKGRTHQAAVRKAWESCVGQVIVPAQELGADDLVDVAHGISIECKNQRAMALAAWVDQAAEQAGRRGGLVPVVVHKRAGTTDPGRWYVTLELRWFAVLVAQLKRGRA